ncbi:hypothetical protein C5D34_08390 [Rathayibacter sp. AY1B1]|uniref:hypothetical protein n=1 Tax=unclassified Rathayibacter TaxID=2609250 RepID=UPI000CE915E6|nr:MULTISPECIES: hypothetical protein [unclassified Rathayibacter]PPI25278.1 hypothetical protein C5D08_01825 [Rathayibacter sp. AY1B6]PPI34857.1 hypothetical protein C5D34_08390 [Rathayibacter sp. AY1B1]
MSEEEGTRRLRPWLLFGAVVAAALVVLWLLMTAFPASSDRLFLIGSPILILGAALGAKGLQRRGTGRREEEP